MILFAHSSFVVDLTTLFCRASQRMDLRPLDVARMPLPLDVIVTKGYLGPFSEPLFIFFIRENQERQTNDTDQNRSNRKTSGWYTSERWCTYHISRADGELRCCERCEEEDNSRPNRLSLPLPAGKTRIISFNYWYSFIYMDIFLFLFFFWEFNL